MYETTTPPQKALNIYSQAPWLLICLLFFASPLLGQSCPQPSTGNTGFDQSQQLFGDAAGQKFGGSLAMSGRLMVVGSPQAGSNAQGEAEVFRRIGNAWVSEGLLPADLSSPLQVGERFGASVDVDDNDTGDDLIVVSTRPVSDTTGLIIKAYVYRNSGSNWQLETTLTHSTQPVTGTPPGSSVAVDDETIVVGVPDFWGGGAAFIHRYNGGSWNPDQGGDVLAADLISQNPTGPIPQHLGTWVDIDDDQIAVGDPYATVGGLVNAGVAYLIHRKNGATWLGCNGSGGVALTGGSTGVPTAGESFGGCVAIAGDVLVIGAHDFSNGGTGSAYVYRRLGTSPQTWCNWTLEQQLFGSTGLASDAFGRAVAIEADFPDSQQPLNGSGRILSGASRADIVGSNSGTAYVYDYALIAGSPQWTEVAELQPDDPLSEDRFGINVAIAGCTIGVSAHLDDAPGFNAGSTTLFLAPECEDCAEVTAEIVSADPTASCASSVILDMTNLSSCALVAAEVSITYPFGPPAPLPFPYSGPTVSPSTISFNSPVSPGDAFLIDVLIADALGGSCVCLEIILLASDGAGSVEECCRKTVCVRTAAQAGCGDCNGNGVPDSLDISLGTSEDCNFNGSPDECDIANGTSLDINGDGIPDECVQFVRGDTNASGGSPDIADVINSLLYTFNMPGGISPCDDASDVNDDGIHPSIADAIYLVNYLFPPPSPPPPAPFPNCGIDPTPDPLGCDSFPPCP